MTDGGSPKDGAEAGADARPISGTPLRVLQVATGLIDTCVLLDNHRVKCWGPNGYGSLGLGDMRPRGAAAADMGDALPFVELGAGRTATALSAGRYHACAILDDGSVKCWGYRAMTGLPAMASQSGVGDEPGEMGDALPALDLGVGRKATQLACGYAASCALLDDGSLKCWGSDMQGGVRTPVVVALANTAKVRQLAPAALGVVALFEDGTISPILPANTTSITFATGEKATYIAGSMASVCAVLEGGTVRCRSSSWAQTLDYEAISLTVTGPSCSLSKAGAVNCLGGGQCTTYWCDGAATPPAGMVAIALGQRAIAIGSGGLEHSCAILADGGLKCWTTVETCPNSQGGADVCAVPLTPNMLLGGSIDIVGTGASRKFGLWRTIDLGKHP